jgi:hypothetical protein
VAENPVTLQLWDLMKKQRCTRREKNRHPRKSQRNNVFVPFGSLFNDADPMRIKNLTRLPAQLKDFLCQLVDLNPLLGSKKIFTRMMDRFLF